MASDFRHRPARFYGKQSKTYENALAHRFSETAYQCKSTLDLVLLKSLVMGLLHEDDPLVPRLEQVFCSHWSRLANRK